jgi:phosphoribosylformimino-5-aminoimidazole carboxamide ribotide isomerase
MLSHMQDSGMFRCSATTTLIPPAQMTLKTADNVSLTMTRFRPCIDLHSGQVKQIVGGTLTTAPADLKTNYVSKLPAAHFSKLYKDNNLLGAHVIMLGPGNEEAAKEALREWMGGLQVGGGITDASAAQWIEQGAEKVCLLPLHGKERDSFSKFFLNITKNQLPVASPF